MVVAMVMKELNIIPKVITLGEIDLGELTLDGELLKKLEENLSEYGFEVISDKKSRLIERIKTTVIELIKGEEDLQQLKTSEVITKRIPHDYNYLSTLFSSVEGITIEQFFILQKIERVKELLIYDELTLTEIAYRLGYSSVAHLSNQFKKITGMPPSRFKALRNAGYRKSLDKLI